MTILFGKKTHSSSTSLDRELLGHKLPGWEGVSLLATKCLMSRRSHSGLSLRWGRYLGYFRPPGTAISGEVCVYICVCVSVGDVEFQSSVGVETLDWRGEDESQYFPSSELKPQFFSWRRRWKLQSSISGQRWWILDINGVTLFHHFYQCKSFVTLFNQTLAELCKT